MHPQKTGTPLNASPANRRPWGGEEPEFEQKADEIGCADSGGEYGIDMAGTWITEITHFLDENGEIINEPPEARKLGEYLAAIIVMASYPDPEYPPEYRVLCRRRPKRKPCLTEIAGWLDPETDDVVWICPVCQDKGIISNWRGTIWDMSDIDEFSH